jgi:hypothetical protein
MPSIEIIKIDESCNEDMLEILRSSPINAGGLSIYFDKEPNIFLQPKMKYFLANHSGLFIDGRLKGFGSVGYYDGLIGGCKEPVFYFHNFYVLPEARGHKFLYKSAIQLLSNNDCKSRVGFSITMKGNKAAEHYFNYPAVENIFKVNVIDSLVVKNIIFSFPKKNTTRYKVRNATIEDVPEIVKLLKGEYSKRLFGNYVTIDNFLPAIEKRKGLEINNYFIAVDTAGKIVGVCAAWDCSAFRQTRVVQYSKKFWSDLLGYSILSSFLPMAPFPKKGQYFKELTLLDYAVEDRSPAIMHALLCGIYSFYIGKDFHYINWGSCGSDPLLEAAKGFWHKNTESSIVLIADQLKNIEEKDIRLPYVEIPFL